MKIFVKVKPNAKEQKVIQISDNSFIVYLKSPPVKNKANIELVEVLSEYFKIPKSKIKILSGLTSRNKIIEIFV